MRNNRKNYAYYALLIASLVVIWCAVLSFTSMKNENEQQQQEISELETENYIIRTQRNEIIDDYWQLNNRLMKEGEGD